MVQTFHAKQLSNIKQYVCGTVLNDIVVNKSIIIITTNLHDLNLPVTSIERNEAKKRQFFKYVL